MNRLYTLAGLALVAGSLSAQQVLLPNRPLLPAYATRIADAPRHAHASGDRDVIFTEDFSNGLAGNNGVGAWTTNGPNGNLWKRTQTGPAGAWSDTAEKIHSTTYLNGWMILNTDSANAIWTATDTTMKPDNQLVDFDAGLVSPLLDLSATPYVNVVFQQRFRYCCSNDAPEFLQVSTDGGTSWPYSYDASNGQETNDDAGTMTVSINISAAIAANPSTVKFRFYHDGSGSSNSHYHWQVDDVTIETAVDHDLEMIAGQNYEWSSSINNTYDSLDYTIVPVSQLTEMPLNVRIFNNGANDETNVVAHFEVTDASSNVVFSNEVNIGTFPAADSLTVRASEAFIPPSTTGTYTINFSLTSDATESNTENNAAETTFQVSDNIYARDDDASDGSLGLLSDDEETTELATLGNGFHAVNDVTLYAVDVAIATGADVGTTVFAEVRDANDLDNGLLVTSEEYQVATADLNPTGGHRIIHFILTEPLQLTAGTDYFVGLKHLGGAMLRVSSSGDSPDQSSFLYGNGDNGVDWYFITSTPMVRMNFDSHVGIEERDVQNGVGLGQNFPNPVLNTITTIPYSLTTAAQVTMDIYDVSGKLVRSIREGSKGAGAYRINLNTADMQQGVYFYTLSAGETRVTKRMTVVH